MRRDLRRAMLAMVLGATLVLGLPFGVAGTAAVRFHARQQQLRRTETVLASIDPNQPMTEDQLRSVLKGYGAQLTAPDGTIVTVGTPPARTRTHQTDNFNGYTLLVWSQTGIGQEIAAVWGLVVVLTLLALALAWLIAARVSRRLTQPLDQLAAVAAQIGQGDLSARAERSSVPEVDRIADTLNTSTSRLAQLIARERQFSANVAHQLRTPITGLLFRLDAAAQCDSVGEMGQELAAATTQTERLADIVELLLSAASSERRAPTTAVELCQAVGDHLADWRLRVERAGRSLELQLGRPVWVEAADTMVEQVLDVLVDNAIRHGVGAVSVRVEGRGRRAVVRVADEGRGLTAETASLIFQRGWSRGDRSGLGLEVARALVEQSGGRLELVSRAPTAFEMILPAVRPAGAAPGGAGPPATPTRDEAGSANYDRPVPPTSSTPTTSSATPISPTRP